MNTRIFSVMAIPFFAQVVQAQETQPAPGPGNFLIMMIPILLIVYFLMIVPEKKKQKARQLMLQNVKKGDRVVTVGGIVGTIGNTKGDNLTIKTGENTVIEVTKSSVSSVITDENK
ncbi:Preprotein translocase subunit YajC [Chitinispirillum alkaliphilum]|nr:Preprotein translocase subunit YajC [Chitinispirillum alkaliphilum]